jgi:hypothetical protein
MKIKDEYRGKTIVKNTSLGNKTIVVDNIDVSKYRYYVSIGFGYLFEKEAETATVPEPIRYEGIEADEQATQVEAPAPTQKPTRKKPTNATAKRKRK